jgi:DNA-binding NarL/FixJ family response regulator
MKILLADDHEMVRLALKVALSPLPGVSFVEAASARQAAQQADLHADLDLALLDLNMPGSAGLDAIRALREGHPALPIAVCSASEDRALIRELFAIGIAAFIPKTDSTAVILQAVKLVLAGGTYLPTHLLAGTGGGSGIPANCVDLLTPRQREVLARLAEGKSNKLIARELGLSESTVKVHLLAVFRELGAHNRTEAVLIAQRLQPAHR